MKCKRCNSENIEVMTTMTVLFPIKDYFHKLTKRKLQSKDFKVIDVNWDKPIFICKDCGYTLNLRSSQERGEV